MVELDDFVIEKSRLMLHLGVFLFFWDSIQSLPVSNLFLLFVVLFFLIVWILVFLLSLRMFFRCVWLVVYRFFVLFVKGILFFFQWRMGLKVHIMFDIYNFLHILFCMGNLDINMFGILILILHLSLLFHLLLIFDYWDMWILFL